MNNDPPIAILVPIPVSRVNAEDESIIAVELADFMP